MPGIFLRRHREREIVAVVSGVTGLEVIAVDGDNCRRGASVPILVAPAIVPELPLVIDRTNESLDCRRVVSDPTILNFDNVTG